jgi:hypothetical protein
MEMSSYRDERETLRREQERLTERLAQAQSELEDKDAEIARLTERLAGRDPAVAPYPLGTGQPESRWRRLRAAVANSSRLFWIGAGALVIGGIVVAVLVSAGPQSPPAPATTAILRARVTSVSGSQSLKPGAACELTIRPETSRFSSFNCHVTVLCGSVTIYGNPHGYCKCETDNGVTTRASDPWPDDGDPALDIDTKTNRASVSAPGWKVELQLDEPDAGASKPTSPSSINDGRG